MNFTYEWEMECQSGTDPELMEKMKNKYIQEGTMDRIKIIYKKDKSEVINNIRDYNNFSESQ